MRNTQLTSTQSSYVPSPFDSALVDYGVQVTAIAILCMFSVLFLAGLIGHCCVIAFVSCRKRHSRSASDSAYVIIGNMTAAHLLFVITCLPVAAYDSVMELVTTEWMFGDIACRAFPFIKLFLLGVTTLSFFAFAIDRFRSSAHVSRGYEYSGDSTSRTVCKMMVVWIGALLLASPELLRVKTSTKILPVNQSDVIYIRGTQTRSEGNMVISKSQYETLRKSLFQDEQFESGTETAVNSNNRGNSEPVAVSGILDSVASNTTLYVAYDVCLYATSWNESLPSPLHIFMVNYVQFRNWWLIIFYFFLPIFFALLFAALISRRLTSALRGSCDNPVPFTGSYYLTNGGTLTSQQDPERAGFMESSVFKTNSLMSSHTHMSDALYQQRGVCFFDRQVSHNQQIRRLSPVISTEDLQDASPTVVMSNGSVRTVDSSHRLPDLSPQSPLAPSIACASGVSVISLAMSNAGVNGAGTIGSRSLPPHGHRRSIKRSSHTSKQTIRNVSREKTLNLIFVAIVFGFTLTQLPFRMATILQSETTVMSMLDQRNVEIIFGLCRYLSHITFVINPIILCLFFKLYRRYIAMRCCCCCC